MTFNSDIIWLEKRINKLKNIKNNHSREYSKYCGMLYQTRKLKKFVETEIDNLDFGAFREDYRDRLKQRIIGDKSSNDK